MRTTDLFAIGLAALWRQKLRTVLTLLGVVIGTATLVISVAIGEGVREAIRKQFEKEEDLRQISVFPSNDGFEDTLDGVPEDVLDIQGEMSEDKRERIRKVHAMRWKRRNARPVPKPLTRERVEQLAAIPHVKEVILELDETGRAFFNGKSMDVQLCGVPIKHQRFTHRVEFGGSFSSETANECVVHEYLLYRMGIRDDAEVRAAIGKSIRIEMTNARRSPLNLLTLFEADLSNVSDEEMRVLEKAWKLLPQSLASLPMNEREKEILAKALSRKSPLAKKQKELLIKGTFTLVGVVRAPIKKDPPNEGFLGGTVNDADVILPSGSADAFFMQLPRREENGYRRVRLIVDDDENLEEVDQQVKRLGLNEFSMGLFIQQLRRNVVLIGFAMDFIALVAIIVSAIGITNTMFTTVLERTREIGIMKAIGAKDRQILTMFLIEGTLVGLVGGACGVVIGWLAQIPGNSYALRLMEKQGQKPLPDTVFLYPIELVIAVPLFAMLVTTLAALLPARRAARVEPVVALRHE